MSELRFRNRADAGRLLADALYAYAGRHDAIVLALPRGGVPVAAEVARELRLPLDVFLVRKIGVPGFEELAMGAIAAGGVRILNEEVIRSIPYAASSIEEVTQTESRELARRECQYRKGRPPLALAGRCVLLVDDGLATGATMRVAVAAVRKLGAGRVVVAVPVGPHSTCELLETEADEVVCPLKPYLFESVGQFYEDFGQTTDQEVCELLRQGAADKAEARHVAD